MERRKHHLWGTSPRLRPPGSWLGSRRHGGICVQPQSWASAGCGCGWQEPRR